MILPFRVTYNHHFEEHIWMWKCYIYKDEIIAMFGVSIFNTDASYQDTAWGKKRH